MSHFLFFPELTSLTESHCLFLSSLSLSVCVWGHGVCLGVRNVEKVPLGLMCRVLTCVSESGCIVQV